jgi:hypothetical protein
MSDLVQYFPYARISAHSDTALPGPTDIIRAENRSISGGREFSEHVYTIRA